MKEFKMTIADFFGNRKSIINGFRIISKFELTDELLKNSIRTYISNLKQNEETLNNYGRNAHPAISEYNKIADFLCDNKYGYKRTQVCDLNDKYYSYETFYLSIELKEYGIPSDSLIRLANAINDYRNQRGVSLTPCDICICISCMGIGNQYLNYLSNPAFPNEVIKTLTNPKKDIAINFSSDMTKGYNNDMNFMKIHADYFEGIEEAIDKINGNTFLTIQLNSYFPFIYGQIQQERHTGLFKLTKMYDSRFYLKIINDTMVFYDGKKSYSACLPYIKNWKANIVIITQFSKYRDFFYQPNFPDNERKTTLHFINRDRIKRTQINRQGLHLKGEVQCNIGTKRAISYSLILGRITELVIPVDSNGNSNKVLYNINRMILGFLTEDEGMFYNCYTEYRNTLILGQEVNFGDEDILSQWFTLCVQSTKSADNKILKAYQKMGKDLKTEYKQLGYYVNNYDFSKCMPVPKLEIDKKLKNNYYKTLHIEPVNIIIDNINNKKIEPIKETRAIARFVCENKGVYMVGELPIQKFYDVKTNKVKLGYNKMKGEVICDKTKNRRQLFNNI